MSIGLGFKIGKQNKQLKQFYLLNTQAATENQLIVRVTDVSNSYSYNSFLTPGGTYRQMVDFTPVQLANTPPSYTFKAVSQGSQCGIFVTTPNSTIVNYEDNIAKLQIIMGIITSSKYKLTAQINTLPAYGSSNTVCYTKMQRNIRFLFGLVGTGWKTTYEYSRPSPSNIIPWDCVPGSTQSLSGRNGGIGDNSTYLDPTPTKKQTFGGNVWRFVVFSLAYPLAHVTTDFEIPYQQDLFTFVPITSSLDVSNADINSFNRSRLFPIDGLAGSQSVKYIAQEKFIKPYNGQTTTFYNLNHTDFSKRNATWIYNEMEPLTNPPLLDCTNDYCVSNLSILGEKVICNSNIFKIDNLPVGATVDWSIPAGFSVLQLLQNTPALNQLTINNQHWYEVNNLTLTATVHVGICNFTVTKLISNDNSAGVNFPYEQIPCDAWGVQHGYLSGYATGANFAHQGCLVFVGIGDSYTEVNNTIGSAGLQWGITNHVFLNNTQSVRCLFFILPLGSGGIPFTFTLSKGPGSCYKEVLFFSVSNNGKSTSDSSATLPVYTASPNPVKDILNVKITNSVNSKILPSSGHYLINFSELNTLLPLKQLRIDKTGGDFQINMACLKTGYYAVEINDGQNKQVFKIYKL